MIPYLPHAPKSLRVASRSVLEARVDDGLTFEDAVVEVAAALHVMERAVLAAVLRWGES